MSPLSTTVLGGAALLASPALYQSLVGGTLPLDVALTRFLVALVVCWLALTLLTEFVFPQPDSVRESEPTADPGEIAIAPAEDLDVPGPLLDVQPTDVVAPEHALEGPAG